MLKILALGVSAIALLSGSALAAPGNTSTVTQASEGNAASVDQDLSQWGSGSTVDQQGSSNTATVLQRDDGSSVGSSASNSSLVTQSGESNSATVSQRSLNAADDDSAQNFSSVDQGGGGGVAEVTQVGQAANSYVNQLGSDQTAFVEQRGPGYDFSSVDQDGSGQSATVFQRGLDEAATMSSTVSQTGELQAATVTQIGYDGTSSVTQSGLTNTATVNQNSNAGGPLFSDVLQENEGNIADVIQSGADASSIVSQTGTFGVASVSQNSAGGNLLDSVISQNGDTDSATVTQSGVDASSDVQQDGGISLIALVTQNSNGGGNLGSLVTQNRRREPRHRRTVGRRGAVDGKSGRFLPDRLRFAGIQRRWRRVVVHQPDRQRQRGHCLPVRRRPCLLDRRAGRIVHGSHRHAERFGAFVRSLSRRRRGAAWRAYRNPATPSPRSSRRTATDTSQPSCSNRARLRFRKSISPASATSRTSASKLGRTQTQGPVRSRRAGLCSAHRRKGMKTPTLATRPRRSGRRCGASDGVPRLCGGAEPGGTLPDGRRTVCRCNAGAHFQPRRDHPERHRPSCDGLSGWRRDCDHPAIRIGQQGRGHAGRRLCVGQFARPAAGRK